LAATASITKESASATEKAQMCGMHLGGVKNETIADYFQRHLNTVYRIIAKVERKRLQVFWQKIQN